VIIFAFIDFGIAAMVAVLLPHLTFFGGEVFLIFAKAA
jgi:hypothetical protein